MWPFFVMNRTFFVGSSMNACRAQAFGRCQTAGGKRFRGFDQRARRVAPRIQLRTRPNKAPPVTMPST